MFLNAKHTAALCFAACMSLSTSAIADIVISGTRVIYKSDQKSVNVRLENKGNNPLLVQSWTVLNRGALKFHLPPPHRFHVLMPNVVKPLN